MFRRCAVVTGVLYFVLYCTGSVSAAIRYTMTDLGALVGSAGSYGSSAAGINVKGQVAVNATTDAYHWGKAFLYNNGTMADMGSLPGGPGWSWAGGINDSGQVAGASYISTSASHVFLYSNGTMTDLGTLPGYSYCDAYGINNSGQVVGVSGPSSDFPHAFLYSNGIMKGLGTLGGNCSTAYAVNTSGQVVGNSDLSNNIERAFLYSGGTMTDLGTLPGGLFSSADDINDRGKVVGWSETTGSSMHAFLYSGGTMTDLGTLSGDTHSWAHAINTSGQVVGESFVDFGDEHAFFYDNGKMVDLNSLVDPATNWLLQNATDINDSGWIVGWGSNSTGQSHAFLLTPIPEPSTLILLGIGAISLFACACRRRRKLHNLRSMILAAMVVLAADVAIADTFGSGASQFTIDFVPISGATNPANGIFAGSGFAFTGVTNDYRIGTCEVTNDQWNKFEASLGVPVTGSQGGYGYSSNFTGTNVPVDSVNWYGAVQFVNWLNTSTGDQPAYKFTGTQGTSDYTFAPWSPTDAGYDASNPYRNRAANYFLPTENEWVKAAYWNGTTLQQWATKDGNPPTQGSGTSGTGWNYFDNGYATSPSGPWNVGSGSQELNGTYDMMGNDYEWMESPYVGGAYDSPLRSVRGGYWVDTPDYLDSYDHTYAATSSVFHSVGFRVASVPEPGSLALLVGAAIVGLLWWRRSV